MRVYEIYKSNQNNPGYGMKGCQSVFSYLGSYNHMKSKYAGALYGLIMLKRLGEEINKDFSKDLKKKLENIAYYREQMLKLKG